MQNFYINTNQALLNKPFLLILMNPFLVKLYTNIN